MFNLISNVRILDLFCSYKQIEDLPLFDFIIVKIFVFVDSATVKVKLNLQSQPKMPTNEAGSKQQQLR